MGTEIVPTPDLNKTMAIDETSLQSRDAFF